MRGKHVASIRFKLAIWALSQPLLAIAQQTDSQAPLQQPPGNWPGPWHMWGGGWHLWWICPLFMLSMVVICFAVFFLGHRVGGGGPRPWGPWRAPDQPFSPDRAFGDPTYSAIQILNERFAKGEIQRQEYEEKRDTILLSGKRPAS